jgi:hypothetical protein
MAGEIYVVGDEVGCWWVLGCEGWMGVLAVQTFLEAVDPGGVRLFEGEG